MKSHNLPGIKRPWFRLGPGLLLALVMAGALIASGQLFNKAPADPSTGSIVWEADAQGHLRQVSAPTVVTHAALPRLWKPEVTLLVENASILRLTAEQRSRLVTLDAAWRREKAEMEDQMNHAFTNAHAVVERATPEKAASATHIVNSLGDYSTLSAQYDSLRDAYWNQGGARLTSGQKKALARLTEAARR